MGPDPEFFVLAQTEPYLELYLDLDLDPDPKLNGMTKVLTDTVQNFPAKIKSKIERQLLVKNAAYYIGEARFCTTFFYLKNCFFN